MAQWNLFLKFATLGLSIEVVFTALMDNFQRFKNKEKFDLKLKGYTYIWMIPIYGSIAWLGPLALQILGGMPGLLRWFIMAVFILITEYVAGYVLEKTTGRCPWHYETGWHLHHYIRFDYLPFWMLFAYCIELLLT